jgi:hypothetical protein
MRIVGLRLAVAVLALASAQCTHEYHPEYHPEQRYVQQVTYSRVYNVPGTATVANGSVVALPPASPDDRGCSLGRAAACWSECFHLERGWSCELLGVMFRTGEGVFPNAETAAKLHARACALGQCSPGNVAAVPPAAVTSPGNVVIYGDMNGNVVLGH